VRDLEIAIGVDDVERDAHEEHVDRPTRLQHEPGALGQLATAHQAPQPRPMRIGEFGLIR
jgi:hypothetical protein